MLYEKYERTLSISLVSVAGVHPHCLVMSLFPWKQRQIRTLKNYTETEAERQPEICSNSVDEPRDYACDYWTVLGDGFDRVAAARRRNEA